MRVAIISTYPPRACGIATFSNDLRNALVDVDPSLHVGVVSIIRDRRSVAAPEVVHSIRQDVRADYVAAPTVIDAWGADAVLIEHEYGIFGGDCGSHLLALVHQLRQPYVITLHTVLSEPSDQQASVLTELCRHAAAVTVFTDTAHRMMVESGIASAAQVLVVPHGVPVSLTAADRATRTADADSAAPLAGIQLRDRTVLSTFGLISSGKGIETAIEALPAVVARHPEVLYLVAGQTHPDVISIEGERYRLSLERLVRDRRLDQHVQFVDRFLPVPELADLLASTDLYLTPYRSREQIVSGALTFAVAAGCPVVSTPYLYAEDLLATGAGVIVPFDDPDALATAVLQLLDNPADLAKAAAEARRVGEALTWPAVAAQTVDILRNARTIAPPVLETGGRPFASSPPVRPDHLLDLVDDTGVIQHADGVLPNRNTGYCVDDVARLVVVAVGLDRDPGDRTYARTVTLGLSFLHHAWRPDAAGMHNFLSYERRWLDEPHVGDHLGRTIWALGTVLAAHPPRAVASSCRRLLTEMACAAEGSDSLRTIAYSVLGLTRPPVVALPPSAQQLLPRLAARLFDAYRSGATPDWPWFEDALTYDNARLAQALIAAGHATGAPSMITAGVQALDWYARQCGLDTDRVRLVGNAWRRRRTDPWPSDDGDEQPLDAAALVEAHTEAFVATGDPRFGERAVRSFEWFLGRNRRGEPVYDFATGGCRDGLNADGLNQNQGAESTLAYFQALLALEAADLQSTLTVP